MSRSETDKKTQLNNMTVREKRIECAAQVMADVTQAYLDTLGPRERAGKLKQFYEAVSAAGKPSRAITSVQTSLVATRAH